MSIATNDTIKSMVRYEIKCNGMYCDLNDIDVSGVTDMRFLFSDIEFYGKIDRWDVSNVMNMSGMFEGAGFNGDIKDWNVSRVRDMSNMFKNSKFTGDISQWNVSDDCNIFGIIKNSELERLKKDIPWLKRIVQKLTEKNGASLTVAEDRAHLDRLIEFKMILDGLECDLNDINVSKVMDMSELFKDSPFNGDISKWVVPIECNLKDIFKNSEFEKSGKIEAWFRHVSEEWIRMSKNSVGRLVAENRTHLERLIESKMMLYGSECDLNDIDVSKVMDLRGLFWNSPFNGDISKWVVPIECNIKDIFTNSEFEKSGKIEAWLRHVSEEWIRMSRNCAGRLVAENRDHLERLIESKMKLYGPECDLNDVDVSKVMDLRGLFWNSPFNGDISKWKISSACMIEPGMFSGSCFEKSGKAKAWLNQICKERMKKEAGATGKIIAKSRKDLDRLIKEFISFIGPDCDLNDIDVFGVADMRGLFRYSGFNGDISSWNVPFDCDMSDMFTGSVYEKSGKVNHWLDHVTKLHRKMIDADLPQIVAKDLEHLKLLINRAISLAGNDCNLNFIDVSRVKSMYKLFQNSKFVGRINEWKVSNVTDMSYMFDGSDFNGDISYWDVSKVTNMYGMFMNSKFNKDISGWEVSKVQNMRNMFKNSEFVRDISAWKTSKSVDFSAVELEIRENKKKKVL